MVLLVNAGVFNAAWFVCVALRMPWAIAAVAVTVAVHMLWTRPGAGEWKTLAACSSIGIAVDSILTMIGVFSFRDVAGGDVFGETVAPSWLMALWIVFATTLNVSMKPLATKPKLALLLGAIMGPFSYWVGLKLGAVTFPLGISITMVVLAIIWAILFPLLITTAQHFAHSHQNKGAV